MGEIPEMMIDGTLCESCGSHLNGEAEGFPRICRTCRGASERPNPSERIACRVCSRKVKLCGMKDHLRDAHGKTPNVRANLTKGA